MNNNIMTVLHYSIIFIVYNENEIICNFHNMNLNVIWSIWPVIPFWIMTQIFVEKHLIFMIA